MDCAVSSPFSLCIKTNLEVPIFITTKFKDFINKTLTFSAISELIGVCSDNY